MPAPISSKTIDFKNLEKQEWFNKLDDLADNLGHFEPLGPEHTAAFIEAGKSLVVTFESYPEIIANSPNNKPRGFEFMEKFNWSHLAIISHDQSWFRSKRIYQYFDRLIDDGFFEDFDQVLFYGNHQGAYAASAYSVAAPGSRVLAIRPIATQDPEITSWDRRYLNARQEDFKGRFGYAPDMIEAVDKAYIIFDPRNDLDAMHSALLLKDHVIALRTPMLEDNVEKTFVDMGILETIALKAMMGELTRFEFAKLYRKRRHNRLYLRTLSEWLINNGQETRALSVCQYIVGGGRHWPYFVRTLKRLQSQKEAQATKNKNMDHMIQDDDTAA